MPPTTSIENGNAFKDLSGAPQSDAENPYEALISACKNSPSEMQALYSKHRETRNTLQRSKFLSPDFPGLTIDPILHKLINPSQYPDFKDERHCLVFWARPPTAIKNLITKIQDQLLSIAPNLWIMPPSKLHMTALEITFSLTSPQITSLVQKLSLHIPTITDHPYHHRARLVKPMLSYDTSALALSFVPAAGEPLSYSQQPAAAVPASPDTPPTSADDEYTYHHLRRDLFDLASNKAGVDVASRYVVPSAHLTVARFVTQEDIFISEENETPDPGKVERLLETIDSINEDLKKKYWAEEGEGGMAEGGGWIVGQEKGLDCCRGTLWYGDGERVHLGRGF